MTDYTEFPPDAELELRERLTVLESWRENVEPIVDGLATIMFWGAVALLILTLKRRLSS